MVEVNRRLIRSSRGDSDPRVKRHRWGRAMRSVLPALLLAACGPSEAELGATTSNTLFSTSSADSVWVTADDFSMAAEVPAPAPAADPEPAPAPAPEPVPQPDRSDPYAYPEWDGIDLDCPDVGHRVRVDGADPHRLDRDGDGWGCERY